MIECQLIHSEQQTNILLMEIESIIIHREQVNIFTLLYFTYFFSIITVKYYYIYFVEPQNTTDLISYLVNCWTKYYTTAVVEGN